MGQLRVWRGDVELDPGPRQQRGLLALLLARAGRPIGMTDLIDLLWGSSPPASAVNVVHKYVGALRRLLEPGLPRRVPGSYLVRHGNGYRFVAGPETLDLVAFRRLVGAAKAAEEEALDRYLEALRLCHGSSGGDLAESPAATAIFAGLDGEFFDAAIAAAGIAIKAGRPAVVLAPLRLAASMGRLNESIHAALMDALAAAGHQAEALVVYSAIRERLIGELGIDPGQGLRDAQRRVLTQAVRPAAVGTGAPPLATPDGRPFPLMLPAQLPPDLSVFAGRKGELATLTGLVAGMRGGSRTSPLVVAMDGMGGVGKSTLATHFAHQVAAEFPDGQLYLDLRGQDDSDESVPAGDALRSLLYALGLAASSVPDTFDALTGTYRSLTAGKRILVLLDNVRDPSQVRPLLPNSAESLVLVTSRSPLVALAAFDGAQLMRIELPDLESARDLLDRRLVRAPNRMPASAVDADVADEIIELCGRLPLALAILAARLSARPGLSLAGVAAGLRDGARPLEAFPGRGVSDPRTAFSWSYRQLGAGAARLFRLLSVALSPGATAKACVSLSGREPQQTLSDLDELAEAALVTEDENGRFSSHLLVRAYAHELLLATEPAAERQAAVSRLLQYYLHSSFNAQVMLQPRRTPISPPPPLPGVIAEEPASYEEAIEWFAAQREVLQEAVRSAADLGYGIVPWQLAITMQQYLEWGGFFHDWEDVMHSALRAARAAGDVVGEAHILRSLAGARYHVGAQEEAIELLSAALRIYTEHGMALEQAFVHTNFHWVYSVLGRDLEALRESEKAAAIYRAEGTPRSEIWALKASGQSLDRLGQHEQAARALGRALEINAEIGRPHEEVEIRIYAAANLEKLGRPAEAAEQLRRSAEAARTVGHGPYLFEALARRAELLLSLADPAGAYEAFVEAQGVLESFPNGGTDSMRARVARLAGELSATGQ